MKNKWGLALRLRETISRFVELMKAGASDISDSMRTQRQQIAENIKAARLENSLIFQTDDEPISSVEVLGMCGSTGAIQTVTCMILREYASTLYILCRVFVCRPFRVYVLSVFKNYYAY